MSFASTLFVCWMLFWLFSCITRGAWSLMRAPACVPSSRARRQIANCHVAGVKTPAAGGSSGVWCVLAGEQVASLSATQQSLERSLRHWPSPCWTAIAQSRASVSCRAVCAAAHPQRTGARPHLGWSRVRRHTQLRVDRCPRSPPPTARVFQHRQIVGQTSPPGRPAELGGRCQCGTCNDHMLVAIVI